MYLTSSAIQDGFYLDRYGKHTAHPVSPAVEIHDAPEKTVTYAVFMEDKDAVPVCGFSWIHWTVTGLRRTFLSDGESGTGTDFTEGVCSTGRRPDASTRVRDVGYCPMSPPDRPHLYEITVYALDFDPKMTGGFFMNEMFHAIEGHVLATAKISGMYRN